MKEKKKQYLRNKKLKRQGKLDNDDDYLRAEQREKEIMTDRSKPVFGEQAKQPIKIYHMASVWVNSELSRSSYVQMCDYAMTITLISRRVG